MKIKQLLLGVFLIWAPSLAQSQVRSIGLGEAVEQALGNNFDIRIEESQAAISRNNNSWGAAGLYPTVSLQIAQNNRLSNIDNPASFLNGQFSNIGVAGTANAAWTLFDGFAVHITKARLEELEKQADGQVALVIENSVQALLLQYNTAILEKEKLGVLKENLILSKDRYDYYRTRFDIGVSGTFDLLQFENAYLLDSANYLMQQLNYENSLRELARLMGEKDPRTLYQPSEEISETVNSYRYEDLRAKMVSSNQNLKNQFINLEILQKDVQLANAARYPQIDLNLGATQTYSRFKLEDLEPRSGSQLDYYANFSINFTLFAGGAITRQIENARISERVTQLGIEQIEQSLDFQLSNALALYDTRSEILNIDSKRAENAERNLGVASDRLGQGTINSFDFRAVQLELLNAKLSQLQALYNVKEAEINLLRLTGGILDLD